MNCSAGQQDEMSGLAFARYCMTPLALLSVDRGTQGPRLVIGQESESQIMSVRAPIAGCRGAHGRWPSGVPSLRRTGCFLDPL
jgi:hypothetical protein